VQYRHSALPLRLNYIFFFISKITKLVTELTTQMRRLNEKCGKKMNVKRMY
jgi:hypothetical protein